MGRLHLPLDDTMLLQPPFTHFKKCCTPGRNSYCLGRAPSPINHSTNTTKPFSGSQDSRVLVLLPTGHETSGRNLSPSLKAMTHRLLWPGIFASHFRCLPSPNVSTIDHVFMWAGRRIQGEKTRFEGSFSRWNRNLMQQTLHRIL